MNYRKFDKKVNKLTIAKRDEIYSTLHRVMFNEEYNLDDMKFGDVSYNLIEVVFIKSIFYEDYKYCVFYSPFIESFVVTSKETEFVPEEVMDIAEKVCDEYVPKLHKEFEEFQKESGEDDLE